MTDKDADVTPRAGTAGERDQGPHETNGASGPPPRTQAAKASTAKPQSQAGLDLGPSPLMLDGWVEFNRRQWGLEPLRLRFPAGSSGGAWLETVLYLNRGGTIVHPPRNPYMPIRFRSTPTDLNHRITNQWLDLSTELAAEMKRRGVENTLTFAPNVTDIRPWTWAGFRSGVRYTYVLSLPLVGAIDGAVRTSIRKAEKASYTVSLTTDMDEVMLCLQETEERNEFEHGLSADGLRLALSLMGTEHFRAFVAYDASGEPASTAVNLHVAGGTTIGWLGGTRTAHLRSGVVYLVEQHAIDDAIALGATRCDLAGANMRTIAASKAGWGAPVSPYYQIESYSLRRLARWARDWWYFRRPKRKA